MSRAMAAEKPAITGPDMGTTGESLTYVVVNPRSEPFAIHTASGVWVRAIIADKGVSCTLNDQGNVIEIGCDGSFKISVTSDFAQQLKLVIGTVAKDITISGAQISDASGQVHIYNGAPPSIPLLPTTSSPTITNVLAGDTAKYLLVTTNITTPVSDTIFITLTVPSGGTVNMTPRDCVQTDEAGIYTCTIGAGYRDWLPSAFSVRWPHVGTYNLTARGVRSGAEIGSSEYRTHVLTVEHYGPRIYFPLT